MPTNALKRKSEQFAAALADGARFESARMTGRLAKVDCSAGAARLYSAPSPLTRDYVTLRFPPSLGAEMLENAEQFVAVSGKAEFTNDGRRSVFHVEEVAPDAGWLQLQETLARVKPFRPETLRRASVPQDEMGEFRRVINEARGAR